MLNEIVKQIGWSDHLARLGHFRTHDGDEVEIVVERGDGRVSALEVKASSRVRDDDLKGLRILDRKLRVIGSWPVWCSTSAHMRIGSTSGSTWCPLSRL